MSQVVTNNVSSGSAISAFLAYIFACIEAFGNGMSRLSKNMMNGEGDSKAVTEFVIICATLMFGGYILGTFIDVMPTLNASNPFASVMDRLYEVIGSGYTLMIIVVIIIAGMILMWYLNRM